MNKGHLIAVIQPSLLHLFRSFYLRNYPSSLEEAIEYFTVFGGLGWEIDTDIPIIDLIEELILDNYGHLHNQIIDMTLGEKSYHAVLTAIARGDRRTHSAFKRARISEKAGDQAISYLCQTGIIALEPSREDPIIKEYPSQKLKKEIEKHQISDKLIFTSPFLRFWFAFVAPFHKSIQKGDYSEVRKHFTKHEQSFSSLIFERLSIELLKKKFEKDPVHETGSYWDRQVEIDILAKTASGKIIVGECKYTNTKINRSEFSRLQEKCALAGFEADIYLFFSKRGFSNELMSLENDSVLLYSLEDFEILLTSLEPDEVIEGFFKP